MLNGGGHDLPQKPFQIKRNDKLFSRILSKETSKSDSSFRLLYYGGVSSTIPFMWESQPGTPKHPFSNSSLPPLTPPPSYQFSPQKNSIQKNSKPKFFPTFPWMGSKRSHLSPSFSSASVSSSCSSSYSLSSRSMKPFIKGKSCFHGRSRSAGQFEVEEDDDEVAAATAVSPTSTLGFAGSVRRFHGSRGIKSVKKALLSIVGHGTA